MPSRKTSVATLVIVVLVTVTTVVLGVFGAFNYLDARDQRYLELRNALVLNADQVAPSLVLPVWNFDRSQLDKVVEGLMKDPILSGIVVQQAEPKAVLCMRCRDEHWDVQPADKEFPAGGYLMEKRSFSFSNQVIGTVTLYATTKFVEAELRNKLGWTILNIIVLDAVLTLSLYLLLWRWVVKPLKEVEAFAGAVSSGRSVDDFIEARPFHGELESLRSSMERMVRQLETRYAELREESRKHHESDERFRTLIENAPVAIVVVRHGRHLYTNEMYLKMFGFDHLDEALARPMVEQLAPECRDEVAERARQRELGEPVANEYETIGQRKDGSQFNLYVGVTRVQLANGPASVGFLRDISARKKAEERAQHSHEQLRALSSRLESLREEERTHIAREIHDHLGQLLTALKMDMRLLERKISGVTDGDLRNLLAGKITSAQQLTDETIVAVQKIAFELRPGVLDRLGLAAAVEVESQAFQNRTGLPCNVSVPKAPIILTQSQATAMFRIFQEILTNITRHAQAKSVSVLLAVEGNNLVLVVRDDGVGFQQSDLEKSTSLGILGMQERVALLHGSISFGGSVGHGTTVAVKLPLG